MRSLATPLNVLLLVPCLAAAARRAARARAEAAYEALETQGDALKAEWLWPATLAALEKRLGAQGLPPIHVVYLDAALAQDEEPGLILEDGQGDEQVLGAERLGALLGGQQVALLLWSCEAEEPGQVAPLAEALARAGSVPVIALLGLPPAAQREALTALWTALLAGRLVGQAVAEARSALARAGGAASVPPEAEQALRLWQPGEDVPMITFQGRQGAGKTVRFPSAELRPAWQRLATMPEAGGLPPEPAQGFYGRRQELAALEEALWGEQGNGIVWMHGYEGMGKTTLVAHAARWLVRTGRFAQVVYTSFLGGSYPEAALYDLGLRLLGEGFSLRQENPVEAVERALAETPTLVIWDDLEQILPGQEFALGQEGLQELLGLGARLARAGRSRLCVLSTTVELPDVVYRPENLSLALPLGGLGEDEAGELLVALWPQKAPGAPLPVEAWELVQHLGGHPLALCALAPLLAEKPLAEIFDQLAALLPGLAHGEARLRNQALDVALEALLRSFPEEQQTLVLALGLFVTGFMEPLIITITRCDRTTWSEVAKRLAAARLLRTETLAGLSVPFVRLHPALTGHAGRRLSAARRAELWEGFCGSYQGLLSWMNQEDKRSLSAIRALGRAELPNFRRALRLLLQAEQLEAALGHVALLQDFLAQLGFTAQRTAILDELTVATARLIPEEGPLGRNAVQFLLKQGEQLLATGRVAEAGTMLAKLCDRLEKPEGLSYAGDEATFDRALAFHRLGRCGHVLGQAEAALTAYGRAEELLTTLLKQEQHRRVLLAIYLDRSEVLMTTGQGAGAEGDLKRALPLAEELQDRAALATIHSRLAALALMQEDVAASRAHLLTTLDHLAAQQDALGLATTWTQLGSLAGQEGDLAEAERCYQQALELAREAQNALMEGQLLLQLGRVAQGREQFDTAELRYAQACQVFEKGGQRPALAAAQVALAELLLARGKLAQARIHAEAARVIAKDLGPQAQPWRSYAVLQKVAQAEGDAARAKEWRERARESFANSPEAIPVLKLWQGVIEGVAQACRGETLAQTTVELLEKLETSPEWSRLVQVIWRILGGERGAELYEELDHVDATVVQELLEAIAGPEAAAEGQTEQEAEAELPLAELAGVVLAAMRGNRQAQGMASMALNALLQEESPAEHRQIAQALLRIIGGERGPEVLAGLPETALAPLQELLRALEG